MKRFLVGVFALAVISHGFEIQPRIVNGIESEPSDFPFYAFLDLESQDCGGTLISDT